MSQRKETPPTATSEVFCGKFRRDVSYATWRPYGSGDWLIIYTSCGAGLITVRDHSYRTCPGDVILYSANEPQDYRTCHNTGEWEFFWAHFKPRPAWQVWLKWPRNNAGIRMIHLPRGEIRKQFQNALNRMLKISRRPLPLAMDITMNALEEALLWALIPASDHPWVDMDQRVRKALDYMTQNMLAPFSLRKLSSHCALSISRMAHLFKATLGISPQQFLENYRMEHARNLLKLTDLNISEVAAESGYSDPFYFSTRFKRYTGMSPKLFKYKSRPDQK